MTKGICAMLLALTMVCTTAFGVYAEEGSVTGSESAVSVESYGDDDSFFKMYGDWSYVIWDDGSLQIVGYEGSDSEVTIPSEINGTKVTSIGSAGGDGPFYENETVESIIIPDTVVEIGNFAFEGCKNLKSVTIPDSVTSLGTLAFGECTSLKSVTIPDSVTSLGTLAFGECTSLTSVTIGNSVENIGYNAFLSCTSLKTVKIPKSVKTIEDMAFGYNYNSSTQMLEVNTSFTMKCYSGSAAAKYAKKNKVNYLIIDKKPSTPTIKKASKSKTSVRLYFKSVAGISGYKIQQYNSKKKKWVTVGLSKVNYAKSKGYNYKIIGLKKGTKYKFRVQAYTKLSSKTLKSGWSKTFTVTTKK